MNRNPATFKLDISPSLVPDLLFADKQWLGVKMHGVIEFKATPGEGLFRPYRRSARRTKSGCLSCRTRHTKCDELKPICGGCVRNHLLCSWPASSRVNCPLGPETAKDLALTQHTTSSYQLQISSPEYALSQWPRLKKRPTEQRLLHHYIERSVKRLVVKNSVENPFLVYLLPLAQQNEGFLHAALAISASHLSYDNTKSHVVALTHYGIALRAAKYLITDFGSGFRKNPIEIIMMLLVLCNYEVVDGNMEGAVMQHILPCSTLLVSHNDLLSKIDENCACFIAEQYMAFHIMNHHFGLEINGMANQSLDLSSYYHGRSSSCAYGLFEMIPQISIFARRVPFSHPRHLDHAILNEFHTIEQEILSWEVPEPLAYRTHAWPAPDRDEITAALFLQMALIITLQCALSGPGMPEPSIRRQIDVTLCEALLLLKELSPSSMAWAMLLWPLAHIGSCITSKKEQEDYVSLIPSMENKVRSCTVSISVLFKLWQSAQEDDRYYGPYGIWEFMRREGIQPCIG
ncbi:fungal-specific transcription factor domain-containing protein [Penicillium maclennaniae]|uniref:fungal-specific transcription factor domain-containing protein n=1 Tax=Penicillium maclennaniae TaxID=1343394 RepID=UPI00253FA9A9|nr:fungal-specific transcription factor domain-containing protein [Penicillium maclennaniae]KAJ5678077.1 fungal-specific transcription factor domain-containing protein [Penicillium maclennaniae]